MSELQYLDLKTMLKSADPSWLIDGLLPARGLTFLVGRFGAGKTFLALDLALHVITGRPWQHRTVKQGEVTYCYSEGFLKTRVAAWYQHHGLRPDDHKSDVIIFGAGAVNLLDRKELERFLRGIDGEKLLVFETLSSMTAGADENDSGTAGQMVEALHYVEKETGAAVLVTHHTPLDPRNQRIRGHSRLGDGADTILLLENAKGALTLSSLKQREADAGEPIHLRLTPTHGSLVIEAGAVASSANVDTVVAAAAGDECTVPELAARLNLSAKNGGHVEIRVVRRWVDEAIAAGRLKHSSGTGLKNDPKRFRGMAVTDTPL